MAIVALTNSSNPVTVERATADSDPYERETQLNGLALNFDAHDHTSAKGLGVGRVQTSTAPAAAGQVRVNGDAWQWWGATAGAVRTALAAGDALIDPVVRDALLLGEQGSALAPDVTLTRTAPRQLAVNATVTTSPDGDVPDLQGGGTFLILGATTKYTIVKGTNVVMDCGAGGSARPGGDNAFSSGDGANRWTVVYATAGAINTSDVTAKSGIAVLDGPACVEAVKTTDWVSFAYLPPAYQEPPEQEGQGPEERQRQVDESRAAHAKMLVETAPARHQRGYVLGSDQYHAAELFGLEDRTSASPGSDVGTLGAALQEVIRRLELLEAPQP